MINGIKVTPLYSNIQAGCYPTITNEYQYIDSVKNLANNPIIKLETESQFDSLTPIKDILESKFNQSKSIQMSGQTNDAYPNEGNGRQLPSSGTELMNPIKALPYEKPEDHISTIYAPESVLYTKNVSMMSKDGCNKLQFLVPMSKLTTILGGTDNILEDHIFTNEDDNYLMEIICEISEINKITSPGITKLLNSKNSV